MATATKPPLQRCVSFRTGDEFKRHIPKKMPHSMRVYDGFVRDTFSMARVPLYRDRSYYELCPLGLDPGPAWDQSPPAEYLPMPAGPSESLRPKMELTTQIDYSTFHPRRTEAYTGGSWRKRIGDYHPLYTKRPELVDKERGDRNLERRIDELRSWRVHVPSVYPTSWEKAYLHDPSRFKSLSSLLPNSSVDCYSFSNPRAHKAALMAATLRTSPDFWKYTFPHEYQPSGRLARLDYHFTHGYHQRKDYSD